MSQPRAVSKTEYVTTANTTVASVDILSRSGTVRHGAGGFDSLEAWRNLHAELERFYGRGLTLADDAEWKAALS